MKYSCYQGSIFGYSKVVCSRPIPNLDAGRSFVFVLISRFCKWRALIGVHFCQAFLQKDKTFSCGRVGVVFLLYHSSPAKSVNKYYFFVEVDETSIDISTGFPERTLCSSVIRTPLRSDDATAAKTSLQKRICVHLVFIAIIPAHLLCQM